ncbi:glycosyltransferase family 39 protein [Agromyces bauzanensis]
MTRWSTRWPRHSAPLVGVLAGILSAVAAGVPSYWGDEAASVLSAQRSVPSLMGLLGRIDAVHGAYYLFLHEWIRLVGTSEAAVRLPSAVAIGVAAAGVVVLGSRLLGPAIGVLAGLVFAVLPIVTHMGIEARSYAFAIAAAVWLSVWLHELVRRRESRWWAWALFAVGFAAGVYLFLYLALLAPVHLAIVLGARASRPVVVRWLAASVGAAVLAAPIVLIAMSQREQIAFLARRDYATADAVLVEQWFGSAWALAVAAWCVIAIAVATAAFARAGRSTRFGVVVAVVWMAVPTAVLLAGDAWLTPLYNRRYVAFCAPAVALLIAAGLRALGGYAARLAARPILLRTVPLVGLGLVVALAAPAYLAQRGPYGKDGGSDLRQTADVIAAHAVAGDAIVFDRTVKPSQRPRLALNLYPDKFARVDDIELVKPLGARTALWDKVAPLPEVVSRVLAYQRVWAVESGADAPDVAALRVLGYRVERTIPVHRTMIYELVKEQP